MADPTAKGPLNISGMFYVDDQCIACDACVVEAPSFFVMNDDEGTAFVAKQPTNFIEIIICDKALEACPVDAIGKSNASLQKKLN